MKTESLTYTRSFSAKVTNNTEAEGVGNLFSPCPGIFCALLLSSPSSSSAVVVRLDVNGIDE